MEPFTQPTPDSASAQPAPPQNPQPPQDQQQQEPEEFIQQDWSAPPSAGLYDFGPNWSEDRDIQAEGVFRGILQQEGVPLGVVNTVAVIAAKAMAAPPMSDAAAQTALLTGYAQMERIWGDNLEANLKTVIAEAERLRGLSPVFTELFSHPGIGNDPMVLTQLLSHAMLRKGRK